MSLIKTIRQQLGLSVTPANNFTLDASADNGTMKLARGNAGATTQDIMTVDAAGKANFPVGMPSAGGSPIIEFAFNSNGVYIKYADGTLIQWATWTSRTDIDGTNAYGSLFYGQFTWTYPIPFAASVPAISCSQFCAQNQAGWGAAAPGQTITAANVRGLDIASRAVGTPYDVSVMAIGRWK